MSLKDKYKKQVIPEMKKIFSYDNDLAVPKITSITVNVGLNRKETEKNPSYIEEVEKSLISITGQKPKRSLASKSIAEFKIRKGIPVGLYVTLRRDRMYHFLEKLILVTLPRTRDFRGLSRKSVDQRGNLTIGFKDQFPFPEINAEEVKNVHGLEVIITNNAKTKEEGLKLFELLGLPFKGGLSPETNG